MDKKTGSRGMEPLTPQEMEAMIVIYCNPGMTLQDIIDQTELEEEFVYRAAKEMEQRRIITMEGDRIRSMAPADQKRRPVRIPENPTVRFAMSLDPADILGRTSGQIRAAFMAENGREHFNLKSFKRTVWDMYEIGPGVRKVNGKPTRIFMRQGDTSQVLDC